MKIAVITDVHANLPALEAALNAIRRKGCEALFHTGDAIGIGPYPAECLDLLLNTPNTHFVKGNHELWFVDGLPQPQPAWMSDGEVAHQRWTHASLDAKLRSVVADWPMRHEQQFEGVRMTFVHYGLDAMRTRNCGERLSNAKCLKERLFVVRSLVGGLARNPIFTRCR
jgi:protein phosphatase